MMRVSFLLLISIFTTAGVLWADDARSQDNITVQLEGVSLETVFQVLEEQTDFTFSYSSSLQKITPVSISVKNEPLEAVLLALEKKAGIQFNIIGKMIAVTKAGDTRTPNQQKASINGFITDRATGETLISANVVLAEINRGTSSNTSGYYTITDIPPGSYTLMCSYLGYELFKEPVTLAEDENLRLDLKLEPTVLFGEEIVVESKLEKEQQRNIGRSQVSTELIKKLPAVLQPDVFRSVQLLPGVKAASDFSSGLYIRGGGPDQTLILLDETTVYNPSHFFGLYSTFNPDAVKNVQLYKGGYPAEYGGRIGSVLTVFNKDGNRNQAGGTVSVGLLSSRALIEGPYQRGSYMLSIRRSTIEPVLAFVDDAPDNFYFFDINGKLNFDASKNDLFSVAFYSGSDILAWDIFENTNLDLNYGNQTLSAQWKRVISERLFSTLTATASRYHNKPEFRIYGTVISSENNIHDYSLKGDLEYFLNERHTFSTGFWGGDITLYNRETLDEQFSSDRRLRSQYVSAYVQDRWTPSPKWIATGGIRLNAFSEGTYLRLAPRASVEYRPRETIRLQAAYGHYNQFLTQMTNESFTGFDTWLTAGEGVPPARGDQFLLGTKTIPLQGYGLDIEFYYRTMDDLFELDPFVGDDASLTYSDQFRFGKGYAYGAEVLVEKQIGRLNGFIGYTYGITRRKFPGFNEELLGDTGQSRFYPPRYDRTHDINIVSSYRLSERWSLSGVYKYSTGQAITLPLGRTQYSHLPWGNNDRDALVIGKLNASRLPAYQRVDLSFSRKGTFFKVGSAEWQFQLINVFNRKNIWFYNYDFNKNPVKRYDSNMLPALPAITYTVKF